MVIKTSLLEEIGLTKSEIKVYLALLELGLSATGKIVDKSKVSSSKVYEVLDRLIQKGLVSYIIKSGVKHFEAAPPGRIMDYMKEKETKLQDQKDKLQDMIPELELKQKLSKYTSEATIFKGIKGLKTAMDDVLKTMKKGEEYYVMGASTPSDILLRFYRHYHKERAKKGVKVKLLLSETAREYAKNMRGIPLTKIKFSPTELLASSFILMYKDKTLITVPTKNDLTLFRIESKEATESFKSQFSLIWKQETRIMKGVDAVQYVFDEMLEYGHCDFIAAKGYFVDARPKYVDEWYKRAIKKGFTMRNIVDEETKGHRITRFPFAETKYTLPKEFAKLSVFWIYGNKVAISNWVGKEPIVVIIENKRMFNLYKQQFNLLWNKKII